jgi:hypothetical protein
MRQVDACDFCGDAPDGVFEVVPATVPDGPVRLALCTDCRTTLETVVDPLLAADATDAAPAEPTSDDTPSEAADAAPDSPTATRDPAGERRRGDDADGESAGATDHDAAGRTDRDSTVEDDDVPDATDDAGGGGGGGGGSPGESSDTDGVTIEQQGGATPAQRPDGYAQVLRLLENRNGGMARDDLRALATNAYDLTERTFEAAVDAAIENGDVEDTSGGLRRT